MKKKKLTIIHDIFLTLLILVASTLIGFFFQQWNLHKTNVVVVYIFSVLLISRFTQGYLYGITASVISLLLFNWFFTEPFFTLKVYDLTYLITFAIMMFTSIVTSTLTSKAIEAAAKAKERETESNALYHMTNHLADADNSETIVQIIITTTSEVLGCNTACICFDKQGAPERTFIQRKEDGNFIRRELKETDELSQKIEVFRQTDVTQDGSQLHQIMEIVEQECLYPIYGKTMILAVLRIPKPVGATMSVPQKRMIHSIIESAALALERLRSLQEQARSQEETTRERYRSNLLRAISHDIRTPLAGIMGTSEILMASTEQNESEYNLAKNIYQDAQWLHGMVENILNLTRLQDGKLILDKQLEAVEEVIGVALHVMEKRIPERIIDVEMPENVVMAPMDAGLISQVLINLLDNADKHTAKNQKITISVYEEKEFVSISVKDNGSGISEKDLPHIFQMFYTTCNRKPETRAGVGLGLPICQSIIEAHGGKIRAENQKDGGAIFTFTLPTGEEQK